MMKFGRTDSRFTMPAKSAKHNETGFRARRILIIEDDFDSAEVLHTFLELHGHRTDFAVDAVSGLLAASEIEPDVVICDLVLTGAIDGFDIARQLRSNTPSDRPYLIALSGFGQPEDKERSRAAGFDVHLTKPANFDVLLQIIDSVGR
jgi:DNA-binding response OmpR family regulator